MFQEIEAITLTERVITALKNAFFSGKLKPGDVIVERQIAREMNVGTPVVREALISLKHDGFVRRVKNKGSFITSFDPEEVRALYTLRIELETLALQWARPRVTKADLDQLRGLVDRLVEAGEQHICEYCEQGYENSSFQDKRQLVGHQTGEDRRAERQGADRRADRRRANGDRHRYSYARQDHWRGQR